MSPATLTPGTRLGPYEIVSALGSGGMGEVYRAHDATLHREVAIKVLSAGLGDDPDRVARFSREARALAALNHPNVGVIYGFEDLVVGDGSVTVRALVLELVEGETLAARVARGPIPVPEALRLAGQIASALEAAHEKGMVHRDLKPVNVKITPDGFVKVLDFGLAKFIAPAEGVVGAVTSLATERGAVLGTPVYMSPEQMRGQDVDKRADVWAFGCVLFEMLCGRRAFGGDTSSDVVATVLGHEPDWTLLPGQTSHAVILLLRRCLQKDRGRRLRDIGDADY